MIIFLDVLTWFCKGKDVMKMKEIQRMGKKYGINSFGKTKTNLIREIQVAEGNFDCFGKAFEYCDQLTCCFRTICLNGAQTKTKS